MLRGIVVSRQLEETRKSADLCHAVQDAIGTVITDLANSISSHRSKCSCFPLTSARPSLILQKSGDLEMVWLDRLLPPLFEAS